MKHPAIPQPLRSLAEHVGVAPDEVDSLWARHLELCDRDGSSYGGSRWRGLCRSHVEEGTIPTVPRVDPDAALLRKREDEAKALVEQEYRKTAGPLGDWLGDLQAADDCYEPIPDWEKHLLGFRKPRPGEDPIAWLWAAIDGYRGPTRRVA